MSSGTLGSRVREACEVAGVWTFSGEVFRGKSIIRAVNSAPLVFEPFQMMGFSD